MCVCVSISFVYGVCVFVYIYSRKNKCICTKYNKHTKIYYYCLGIRKNSRSHNFYILIDILQNVLLFG